MVTDSGTDMTMPWIRDSVKDGGTDPSFRTRGSSTQEMVKASKESKRCAEDRKLQICPCGWQKITSIRGLRIHQGKRKCLVLEGQSGRIDQHFLRSQSSQSVEFQRQVENHSSQDINNTIPGEEEVQRGDEVGAEVHRPAKERSMEQKAKVRWPRANNSKEWEAVNSDLSVILSKLRGDVVERLEKMGEVIYSYGLERFGVSVNRRGERVQVGRSRRQREIEKLVKERRQLRKQWRKASEEEREGINVLQEELRSRLIVLRRAEHLREKRKKKERARSAFFRNPFNFVKGLFNQEKGGQLKAAKLEVEEYLRLTYSDSGENRSIGLPPDMPPLGDVEQEMDISPPRWREVVEVVRRAKALSAPGPNGVPYRVYKSAPGILKILWRHMRVVWEKQSIPRAWRRAGGVFIPKEKESSDLSQFRMISLLNVEGKIFFSVVAQRLASYLERNGLIDSTVQKAGIPGFAGCLEHTSMIWHQIQTAKTEKKDLNVVFLDLANAFGSVPHSLIWSSFHYFKVPEIVVNLVKAYFQDIRLCASIADFTTGWQRLEVGIMAGCTVSPLAFTMAMEVIIRASKWVVGGERLQNGMRLPPIRAYMDDMTLLTTTVPCTKRLLDRVNKNLKWASMKIKPSKSRSISIYRGKVSDRKFAIDDEEIPTIREKSVKSLGRWYNVDLNDAEQVVQFRKDVAEGLDRIDKSGLPGKLRLWCLQFGLYPRLMWPMSVYEVPLSVAERMERLVSSYIRKWLGAPRCLSTVALYGKGMLQLPVSSLIEEFKCTKVRTELLLSGSKDILVSNVVPNPTRGRKWNPRVAVQEAEAALKHAEIVGNVQFGRGGLGLGPGKPAWNKAGPKEKRKLIVEQVRRQEELFRGAKAVGQAKQGQWLNWEGVEKRKLSWRDLWCMEERRIKFLIGATYDVLPTPQNLRLWVDGDQSCPLCSGTASLKHILSGCRISLSQGRYTWRHNQVLRSLAAGIEERRKQVNTGGFRKEKLVVQFVREGEKNRGAKSGRRQGGGRLVGASDWEMQVDLGGKLVVPQEIVCTNLRPDIVLWSVREKTVYFIELTVPWENSVEAAFERKKARYADLKTESEQRGWKTRVRPVEVGCRGFVAGSAVSLLRELGVQGQNLRKTVREMSDEAARSSQWIWIRRNSSNWGVK